MRRSPHNWKRTRDRAQRHAANVATSDYQEEAARNALRTDLRDEGVSAHVIHLVRAAGERCACGHAVQSVDGFGADGTVIAAEATCPAAITARESRPRIQIKKALPREDDSAQDVAMVGRGGR